MPLTPDHILLAGRVAVVTGAAQGIGAATAMALAEFGADVAVCDRSPDGLDATVAAVKHAGRRCHSAVLDVRDAEAVEGFLAGAEGSLGRFDVLVNNVGGGFHSEFIGVSSKGEGALIDENFRTVTNCVRHGVGRMNDGSSIVNVTSVEARHAAPGFAIYAAMKAAVEQLTKSLALEFGGRGIRVNCVAPNMITTPGDATLSSSSRAMTEGLHPTPLRRTGRAEECAAAIVFLASDMASFITGASIPVDGGTVAGAGWKVRLDGSFGL